MTTKNLLFGLGVLAILAFFGTGFYMMAHFPELYGDNEAVRYQYRGNHIYIILSALPLLMASQVSPPTGKKWKRTTFKVGLALMVLATFLFVLAFFMEPSRGIDHKPLTFYAVFAAFSGVILTHISLWKRS